MSIMRLAESFIEAISAQGVFSYLDLSKYLMKGTISAATATPVCTVSYAHFRDSSK